MGTVAAHGVLPVDGNDPRPREDHHIVSSVIAVDDGLGSFHGAIEDVEKLITNGSDAVCHIRTDQIRKHGKRRFDTGFVNRFLPKQGGLVINLAARGIIWIEEDTSFRHTWVPSEENIQTDGSALIGFYLGDFEGYLRFMLGMESTRAFRASTASNPPRLIIDIQPDE